MFAALPLPLWIGAAFALGACIGSFLNVVIWRLPRGESLLWPASHCPACAQPIPGWANVPIVSWLALRGRCRDCGVRISPRYFAVELGCAAIFAALLLVYGPGARFAVAAALAAALLAITFIDIDHLIIPNEITIPGIALGLGLAAAAPWILGVGWLDSLLGVALWGVSLWGLSAAAERAYGQPAFGMGDVKLIAMFASFFGAVASLYLLVLGSVIGLAYGLASIVPALGRRESPSGSRLLALPRLVVSAYLEVRKTAIPFGPALAVAGLVLLFQPGLLRSSARAAAELSGGLSALARSLVDRLAAG